MKTPIAFALAAVAFSTAAFAHDSQPQASGENYPASQQFVSTKTRAQVIEETRIALARGEIAFGEQYPLPAAAPSSLTRAQVKAELAAAQRSGKYVDGLFVQN